MDSCFRRVLRVWRTSVDLLVVCLMLLVLLNGVAWVALKVSRWVAPPPPPVIARYGREFTEELERKIYPDLTHEQVREMLDEMWRRPVAFHPFTLFKERPFRGKYVNVSKQGYRWVQDQGPWPPHPNHVNVFFFGGSTTFGYGLPDWQTVPSHLQQILRTKYGIFNACVYNFGTSSFYSSQERAYFQSLVTEGSVSHCAIFMDGLNEFFLHRQRPQILRSNFRLVGHRRSAEASPFAMDSYFAGNAHC